MINRIWAVEGSASPPTARSTSLASWPSAPTTHRSHLATSAKLAENTAGHAPCLTTVAVLSLAGPGMMVELSPIAAK